MTFNVTVPNAAQSPGLFPAQNNTNNQRVKDIINADHNFVDTFAANQGAHKQVTYINRAVPGSLTAGTNGVSYTKDVNGIPQLYFYNGVTDQQITPKIEIYSGTITIDGSTTSPVIFTFPDVCQGTLFITNQAIQDSYKYRLIFKGAPALNATVVDLGSSTPINSVAASVLSGGPPTNQLSLRNVLLSAATFFYSIIINRL